MVQIFPHVLLSFFFSSSWLLFVVVVVADAVAVAVTVPEDGSKAPAKKKTASLPIPKTVQKLQLR